MPIVKLLPLASFPVLPAPIIAVVERVEAFTNVDLSNRARGAHVSHDSHATTNNHSNEVHVGQVNIHTPATDAPGLAGTIGPAIEQSFLTTQANYGLA